MLLLESVKLHGQEQQVIYKCGMTPKTPVMGETLRDADKHGPHHLNLCLLSVVFHPVPPQLATHYWNLPMCIQATSSCRRADPALASAQFLLLPHL